MMLEIKGLTSWWSVGLGMLFNREGLIILLTSNSIDCVVQYGNTKTPPGCWQR